MAKYRFLAADLLTNEIREEIPFGDVSYSQILNSPGSFSATLPQHHAKCKRSILDPSRTAIYVERDGVIVWGGILWTARTQSGTVQFGGEGFWSYFRRRFVRETLTFTQTDQLAIARFLVAYAQGQEGGSIGVIVGDETSGVLRDRVYYGYERKQIGEAVEQLAAVIDGFDFAIDCAWSGDEVAKTLHLDYPTRGRENPIVFQLGTNVEGIEQEIDGTRQANRVDALGAGEGDSMLIATSSGAGIGAVYPLLEGTISYKDVSVPATLQAHADAETAGTATPVETIPTLVAHIRDDTTLGAWITGDRMELHASDGFLEVNGTFRVVSFEVKVSDGGREQVSTGFADEESFA